MGVSLSLSSLSFSHKLQACNVVVTQPHGGVTHIPVHSVGDNYLTLSIVLTVLCFLCCTWYGLCCTVPAIIFATMVRNFGSRSLYWFASAVCFFVQFSWCRKFGGFLGRTSLPILVCLLIVHIVCGGERVSVNH